MKKIQDVFVEAKRTLSLAESCTGGLVASMLTKTAGSSAYFLGSFVTYSNDMKVNILNVSRSLLAEKTAVCEEVAKQMCLGALKLAKSDYGVAVTGDAGPDGDRVGTVFGAIGSQEKIFSFKIPNLDGLQRVDVQQKCADFLLESLYNFVKNNEACVANQ